MLRIAVIFFITMIKIQFTKLSLQTIIICVLSLLFMLSLLLNYWQCERAHTPHEVVIKSDTITLHDTVTEMLPMVRDSIVIRREVARLKVVVPQANNVSSDTINNIANIEGSSIQAKRDSVSVEVPIVQKMYEGKGYKAYISGYHASLDSIKLYRETKVITNTIMTKTKRWGVSLQAGYGYNGREFKSYIGIGVSYNIFAF